MKIQELLSVSHILTGFDAKNKEQALRQLSKAFTDLHPELSPRSLLASLLKREELGSTGIGGGIAIPHSKMAQVDKPIGFLALSRNGVDFKALDGEPVFLFFLLVYPQTSVEDHLKALAKAAKIFRDNFVKDSVLSADSPKKIMQILLSKEAEIKP